MKTNWLFHAFVTIVVNKVIATHQHEEHLCHCGVSNHSHTSLFDCAKWDEDGYTSSLLNSITYTTQQSCSVFSVNNTGGYDKCRFATPFSVEQQQKFCLTLADGSESCCIQSPHFGSSDCYPELTYCAHSVVCPPGTLLYYHHSFMSFTANFPHCYGYDHNQCSDMVEVELDNDIHVRCGYANIPTNVFSYSGYVLVQFGSNQGCQNLGYSMWANCVPTYSELIQNGLYEQYTNTVNNVMSKHDEAALGHQRVVKSPKLSVNNRPLQAQEYQANYSTILKYADFKVTIYGPDKSIKTEVNAINTLHVYDSRGTLIETSQKQRNQTMYGYGILKVQGTDGHLFLFGIDTKFIPNEKEKRLIDTVMQQSTSYYNYKMRNHSLVNSRAQNNLSFNPKKALKQAHSLKKTATNAVLRSAINLFIKVSSLQREDFIFS